MDNVEKDIHMWFYYPIINDGSIVTEIVANNYSRDVRRLPFSKNPDRSVISCDFGYVSKENKHVRIDNLLVEGNSSSKIILNGVPPDEKLALGYCQVELREEEDSTCSEFQLSYRNTENNKYCSILYDLFPFKECKLGRLVALLHKTWVGGGLDSKIYLVCPPSSKFLEAEYQLKIIAANGNLFVARDFKQHTGRVACVSLRQIFQEEGVNLPQQPRLFTTTITSNISTQVVLTLSCHENGAMALEHSLPPLYYFDSSAEGIKIIREKAFLSLQVK